MVCQHLAGLREVGLENASGKEEGPPQAQCSWEGLEAQGLGQEGGLPLSTQGQGRPLAACPGRPGAGLQPTASPTLCTRGCRKRAQGPGWPWLGREKWALRSPPFPEEPRMALVSAAGTQGCQCGQLAGGAAPAQTPLSRISSPAVEMKHTAVALTIARPRLGAGTPGELLTRSLCWGPPLSMRGAGAGGLHGSGCE